MLEKSLSQIRITQAEQRIIVQALKEDLIGIKLNIVGIKEKDVEALKKIRTPLENVRSNLNNLKWLPWLLYPYFRRFFFFFGERRFIKKEQLQEKIKFRTHPGNIHPIEVILKRINQVHKRTMKRRKIAT